MHRTAPIAHNREFPPPLVRRLGGLVLVAILGACASYGGSSLKPGQSAMAEVRALMGEPAAIHRAPEGARYNQSWEYPRGPAGRHTYMARFDAGGKLVAIDQVLDEDALTRVGIGRDTREDVRRLLGRPAVVMPDRRGGEIWDYAALSAHGAPRKLRLLVGFDANGIASSAGAMDEPEATGSRRR
jgi:hypothetical protein